MKLLDLEPQFLRLEYWGDRKVYRKVETLQEATGIRFLCPHCFKKNNGPAGTHSIICWSPQVVEDLNGPGRWAMEGLGALDLTLSPSIHLQGGCGWHGWIRNGEIVTAA